MEVIACGISSPLVQKPIRQTLVCQGDTFPISRTGTLFALALRQFSDYAKTVDV